MKRCMMILLVVGLCGLPIQVFAEQSEAVQLTLNRAIQLALEHNETYLSAQMNATRAREQKKEAIAEALPRLSLNTIYTRNWSLPELNFGGQTFRVGADNTMNLSLDFSQPIYSGGKLGAGLKLARYFEEQSDVNREQARQDIVLTIHQSYYAVLLAQAAIAAIAYLSMVTLRKRRDQEAAS